MITQQKEKHKKNEAKGLNNWISNNKFAKKSFFNKEPVVGRHP
jgi:hypothetical protein